MKTKQRYRLSLRQVFTIPYVVFVLALALTIGGLSYVAGSRAVDTVSSNLLLETVGRIGQAVDRHIVGSGAVLEAAFPDGMPAQPSIDQDIQNLRTRFWIATSLHLDPNNYVYYGNRLGQGIGLYRHSRTEGELRIKLQAEEMRSYYRFTGIDGALNFHSREAKLFDPRVRPWYKAGQSESLHTWTAVYIDFGTADLVATRARRVLGRGGEFEGVVATDVSLRGLNDFVTRLKVSPNGLAFIVEPSGQLVASSASANVQTLPNGSKTRVSAAHSGHPVIAAAYAELRAHLASNPSRTGAQTFQFRAPDGQVIHAAFDRLKDDAGLEWFTVVAMPRSDFMAGVTENVVLTGVLSALAALIAIAIGLRILSWVAGDLKRLSEAALRVGDGQLDWPLGIQRRDEIGQLARSFETMQQRLQTDGLTNLANRDAFLLRLGQRIEQASASPERAQFAVLFIDLNRFKHINDHYGHEVGDQVLIEVAQRLCQVVTPDDLVARLSGDEFVVLLDRVDDEQHLERMRQRLEAALRQPFAALGNVPVTAVDFGGSVGEARFPQDGRDAQSLLKHADRRMYRRKFAER